MQRVLEIIDKALTLPESDDFDLSSSANELAEEIGWEVLLSDCLHILLDLSNKRSWYLSASIIFYAAADKRPFPVSWQKCVAVLYGALDQYPDLGNNGGADGSNLVWSAAHILKGVSYTSHWQPLEDMDVIKELEELSWSSS